MSLQKRLLVTLMLSASLVACGGGGGSNNNLFNPEESEGTTADDTDTSTDDETVEEDTSVETDESGVTSLIPEDNYVINGNFVGIFIENIVEEKTNYKLGTALMRTTATPGNLEEGDGFDAMLSYKFEDCQAKNVFRFTGYYNPDDSSLENSDAPSIYIDNGDYSTTLSVFDITWSEDIAFYGTMQLAAASWVEADTCVTSRYKLALESQVAMFPFNSTFYSDTSADVNVELDPDNQRTVRWEYKYFQDNSANKKYTVAVYDRTAYNNTTFFDDATTDMSDDLLVWQQVIDGDQSSFTIPNSVNMVDGNDYLLVVAAWETADSSGDPSNKIYYFSNITFTYKD
jgi:hypothetical protein